MQILKAATVSNFMGNKNFVRYISLYGFSNANNANQPHILKPWETIPGPSSLPYVGSFFQFLPGGKLAGYKGINLSTRLNQLYGPIVKVGGSFGGPDRVFLFDPEAVEHVFRSEEMMPTRPAFLSLEYYRKHHNKTYDPKRVTGVLSDQGENWRNFRTKVNPILMKPKTIQLLYTDVLREISSDMVERLKTIRDEEYTINNKFITEMKLWALESVGAIALGTRLNCFSPNLPVDSPAWRLTRNIHDIIEAAKRLDYYPILWRFYSTPTFKNSMKSLEEYENLIKYYLDQVVKKLEESEICSTESSNSEKPVLERLLEIDYRVAHIMVSDLILAGIDSVTNTVIATLYLLAINSQKQYKLREEILAKQTQKSYLRACIKESMRMLSFVNGNLRITTKEYNLLGYTIPKGVIIELSHQVMSTMTEYYPKADEFIPERWLADKNDPLYHGHTHPFVMGPFGFGVRMCIGRRIAELEMEIIISKLIEHFQIDWTSSKPIKIAPISLNYLEEPFHFAFKDL